MLSINGCNVETAKYTAVAALSAGDFVQVGASNLYGAVIEDLAIGDVGTLVTCTEKAVATKATASVFAQGDPVYYDIADGEVNVDAGNPKIGFANEAAGAGVLEIEVNFNGGLSV